jgi:flagellar biosynthesis GTPase FlhF
MDDNLCNLLITKGELKQSIFAVTLETMQLFKDAAKSFEEYYRDTYADDHDNIPVLFTNKNQYQFMLKFGGDVLIFLMHTNVFEFSRDHEVMRTPYIKEDRDRSYCGMIQIFNFLGDSLKYDRVNDRVSAYEILSERMEQAMQEKEQALQQKEEEKRLKEEAKQQREEERLQAAEERKRKAEERERQRAKEKSLGGSLQKMVVTKAKRELVNEAFKLGRGLLGSLLKGK